MAGHVGLEVGGPEVQRHRDDRAAGAPRRHLEPGAAPSVFAEQDGNDSKITLRNGRCQWANGSQWWRRVAVSPWADATMIKQLTWAWTVKSL
jgi:hypothetical protein